MQRGPDTWRRLVLAHLEDAPGGLDLITCTPSSDEGSAEGWTTKIDRNPVVQPAARPRRRHRPAVGPGILVEPCFDPARAEDRARLKELQSERVPGSVVLPRLSCTPS